MDFFVLAGVSGVSLFWFIFWGVGIREIDLGAYNLVSIEGGSGR